MNKAGLSVSRLNKIHLRRSSNPMKKNLVWLKRWNKKPGFARPQRAAERERGMASVEVLEARIAPATLVNPTTVTYTDIDGDHVTITTSKSIFTSTTINEVLKFNTGSVNGSDATPQQLQFIDLAVIGSKAAGTSLTVSTVQAGAGDGFANVGYIYAAGIDLGAVVVGGDLGRIIAGSGVGLTPGVDGLTVESIGKLGTTTQKAGGNLTSEIRGELTSLNVTTDIMGANFGVGDPIHAANGQILQINVGGSIIGGTTAFSGSIRATGNIGPVDVGGNITGGTAADSGLIGTAGSLGTVTIGGSIIGGAKAYSGVVLATGSIGTVNITGGITGGTGANSGLIGTTGTLGAVTIEGSIVGGAGSQSGALLSSLGMSTVHVEGNVDGGSGAGSGQIGTFGTLAGVTIDGSINGGTGAQSALISSAGTMGNVNVGGSIISTTGEQSVEIISIFGGIGNIIVGGRIVLADVMAEESIGTINAYYVPVEQGGLRVQVQGVPQPLSGIDHSSFTAMTGSIGAITSEVPGGTVGPIVLTADGILASSFTAGGGSIGNITASSASPGLDTDGIAGSNFIAKVNIGSITATTTGGGIGDNAIDTCMFIADNGAGTIGTVTASSIVNSVFEPV